MSPPPSARMPVRFVMNTHGPAFERYSMLCIKSIRRVCGPEAPVSVYQPDNLPPASARAMRFYARHGVDVVSFHNEFLPARLDDPRSVPARYLTLNKVYCLQDMRAGERRFFVDADIVFMKDPRPYLDAIPDTVACPSVDTPEAFGGDWSQLYAAMGVPFPERRLEVWQTYAYPPAPEPPKVTMIPYFSSGAVYVDAASSLPARWLEMCRRLERRIDLVPRSFFLDQIALSLAVHATGEPWTLLPTQYNCTYEVYRYLRDVHLFHYVTDDTLASAVARFPQVRDACREPVMRLAAEDGLDLRLQLLTQWPRWSRRVLGIASSFTRRAFGRPLVRTVERS